MGHDQNTMDVERIPPPDATKAVSGLGLSAGRQHVSARGRIAIRSDSQIRQDVIDELHTEMTIDADSIGVHVKHGTVTLTGRADGWGDKWLIEAAVQRIAGVRSVQGQLEVIVQEPGVRTDDDIRRECEHALGMTVSGANRAIKVMVSSGWVTLLGSVACGHERWSAEEIVSGVLGVTGVNGQIAVRPFASSEDAALTPAIPGVF